MPRQKKRITIKEVAVYANVSIGTVSRLINNNGYVSKEATKRINEAISILQYIPNASARNMVIKQSAIIGIAVPEINNPFLADLVVRVEAFLSKKNYTIMLCNSQYNKNKISNFIDDLIMRNADGLILVASDIADEHLLERINEYMYAVSIGQRITNFDCIKFDDFKAAYDLTNLLISNGHKHIACIGFHENARQTMERVEGFRNAMTEAKLPVNEEYLRPSNVSGNAGYICTQELLQLPEPPTAIIAINDFYAMHAYAAIEEIGLQVGKDISLVGFDDIIMARLLSPSLTTVACDTMVMAEKATTLLLERIDEGKAHSLREIILPSEIILRDSVGRIGDL